MLCLILCLWPQILQYTPSEHPDHQNLQEALTKANELCNQVNEGVRERENSDKLEWIQAHTVCEGLPEVRAGLWGKVESGIWSIS